MAQEVKMKISLDDQVSVTASTIGTNIVSVVGGVTSEVADGFVKTLEQGTDFSGKMVGNFRDMNAELVEMLRDRTGEEEEILRDHFTAVGDGFAGLSEQLISGSKELVESISEFPKAFGEGFSDLEGLATVPFDRIKDFGRDTSKDLNNSFQNFFFKKFKGETASLGDLWKGFANTMRDNFLNALAAMVSGFLTSKIGDLLKGGLAILGGAGKSKGGPILEDGLFPGEKGELVLSKSVVSGLASKGISKLGPETAATLKAAGELATVAAASAGLGFTISETIKRDGFLGLVDPGNALNVATLGLFNIGSLFPFGPKLSQAEKDAGAVFNEIKQSVADLDTAITLTSLQVGSGTGFDSLGDAINALGDQKQIPDDASAFVRQSFFRGLSNLIDDPSFGLDKAASALVEAGFGGPDRVAFTDGIKEGISIKRDFPALLPILERLRIPAFQSGLPFVPFDNFPALLHRGERVLTADENLRSFQVPSIDMTEVEDRLDVLIFLQQKTNQRLERLETAMDNVDLNLKVVTVDEEELADFAVKVFDRRLKTGEITIDASSITGLRSDVRL